MTKKKKLLIVSVSAGAGHVQAARAIEETAKAQYEKEYIVEYVDLMDYVSPALKKAIVDAYGFIIKNAPNVWQYIYKKTDNADRLKRTDSLMKRVNQLTARRFYTLLDSFQPDHIVCTHSFPAQVVQQSKNREHHYIPISLVVTDYGWHSYWILQDISNYFVATEKMKWEMMYHKIPTPVYVTGIPVRPVFFEKKSTEQLKKKYNISLKEKVILVLSGGQGLGASDEVVKYIDSHNAFDGARVIVVAGSN
ncbi:hypothetical protein KKG82_00385, partial [Patescibacteria group bacterium]|nr:hypothetical protein [Patescibacteria group bacterium]